MIEPIAKVLIGTAFYVGIVWVAQRNPRAAGMMLTFPTLNGLVLLMASRPALEDAASAMLLMPLINAAMWAFYLAGFERWMEGRRSPALLSGLLIGLGAGGWLLLAALITWGRWGVPTPWQWIYAAAVLAAGLALTLLLRRLPIVPPSATAATPQSLSTLLRRYRERIVLFATTLAAIAAMDRLGASPALLGAVAGAPLVAMFGMQTIAADAAVPLPARRRALSTMGDGLWLGPGIAIVFVACFWRALDWLADSASGVAYHVAGAAMLLVGWALCLGAIWSASSALGGGGKQGGAGGAAG